MTNENELKFSNAWWYNPKQIRPAPIASYREVLEQYQIFPEARACLEKQLRESKKIKKQLLANQQKYYYLIERKVQPQNVWFFRMIFDGLFVTPWLERHEAIIRRNTLLLTPETDASDRKLLPIQITRARSYPISNLIDFRRNTAKCIFHNDHNPSLHYYPKTNSVYCFSCQASGDAIKVYQTLNNCSFPEAVRKLQ